MTVPSLPGWVEEVSLVAGFPEPLLHWSEEPVWESYFRRLDYLRSVAVEEGITFSEVSERDFWEFLHRFPLAVEGQLIVTDEGHVRLVWRGNEDEQIGIRFLGSQRVRYVIFKRRPGEQDVSLVSGDDTFEGVVGQAKQFDLPVFRG